MMRDTPNSNDAPLSGVAIFLCFSLATNFVQYSLATNGIANLERDVWGYQQKIAQLQTDKDVCAGRLAGFIEGRR